MGLAHSDSRFARILRWPSLQMQRLTTREPDEKMLECAIVSVNVVLNGFPEGCRKTPEGWGIFTDYRQSEPGYVMPQDPEPVPDSAPAADSDPVSDSQPAADPEQAATEEAASGSDPAADSQA